MRSRRCINPVTNEERSDQECFGSSTEMKDCAYNPCPGQKINYYVNGEFVYVLVMLQNGMLGVRRLNAAPPRPAAKE